MKQLRHIQTSIGLLIMLACFTTLHAQLQWTEYQNNPVLEKNAGSWDSGVVLDPTVIKSGDTLKMWYTGAVNIFSPAAIGYAFSLDGINWSRHAGNPVMQGRSTDWDRPSVLVPIVIQDGDTLRMWYGGGSSPDDVKIGYATSVDGVNWSRQPAPVMESGSIGEWNADAIMPGSVIKEGSIFKMWFSGAVGSIAIANANTKTAIGYATSPDGIAWTLFDDPATTTAPFQFSDPVLDHGSPGEDWDANEMFTPSVLKTDSGYEMWYSGWRSGGDGQHLGHATSPDGINWTKHAQNPIFREPGTWNGGHVFPSVILDGEQYRMWYQGWTGPGTAAIGYATAPLITSVDENRRIPNRFGLHQNYPNPFNPTTSIRYELTKSSSVVLQVFDLLGREVRVLVNEVKSAGIHEVKWDGLNDAGLPVSSGLYLYRIKDQNQIVMKKMVMLR